MSEDRNNALEVKGPAALAEARASAGLTRGLAAIGVVGQITAIYLSSVTLGIASSILVLFALLSLAKNLTRRHEQQLSLPPALDSLQRNLGSLQLEPALRPFAERAQLQLNQLKGALQQGRDHLDRKLDRREITYSRFESGLTEAAGAIFKNLELARDRMRHASTIGATRPEAAEPKAAAGQALDENEKALRALIEAVGAIGEMRTETSQTTLPDAIAQLEQIAARAERLSVRQGQDNGENA